MRSGKLARAGACLALMIVLAACDEGALPNSTSTQASAANTPTIAGIEAKNEGDGIVTLTVKATDPTGAALAFAWRVDDGQLASSSKASVQWRVPKAPGTYKATVDVSNPSGGKVSAQQSFTVDAAGQASTNGSLNVVAAGPTATQTQRNGFNGQFAVPSPANGVAQPIIVGGNPAAPSASTPPPTPPATQPVATPNPALRPSPTALPLQPIATPTPTPPPVVRPPSPLPTSKPPTPEPGVPETPPIRWRKYDSLKVPTTVNLRGLHFLDSNTGWLCGSNSTVLSYKKTGDTDPALVARNVPTKVNEGFGRIRFISETTGFVAGGTGVVYRTKDGGVTWEDISPVTTTNSEITALIVVNEQIVIVGDQSGVVWRTGSANATDPTGVVWTRQPTQPFDRPNDFPGFIKDGVGFPTDPTLAYFVGDGVYRLDTDNPDQTLVWKKVLQPVTADPLTGETGDLSFTRIHMVSQNEILVGTYAGSMVMTTDAFTTTKRLRFDKYRNREFNGNQQFLSPLGPIFSISSINAENVWVAGGQRLFDTRDLSITAGTSSWREMILRGFNDMQVNSVVRNGEADFVGWAVGNGGDFYIYSP